MKKTKKILAIVLSVIMIFSIFPSAVLATEADVTGMTAEYAAEAVDASSEEQEVESTVEDVSEEEMEASSEQGAETTDEETVEPATETDEVPVQGMETADEEKVEGPITLTENGDDYTVTAIFDASSGLPAGVQMKVSEIKESGENAKQYEDLYDQTLEAVQKDTKTEVELTYARFFDISFHTESGEVEPSGPVSVNIKYDEAIDVESSDAVSVYHFDEQKEEIRSMDIETAGSGESVDEISFETDGFSIYAVVGTTEAAESRMTLNFYKRNSTNNSEGTDDDELIATVYVKNGDDTDAVLEQIIYDPGVGTLASGQLFKGWIEKENYTTADVNEKMNVPDIRAWAKEKANKDEIKENEEHNFYAMIFNTFSVTYKDEDGVTIRSDALITDGDKVDYTIDQIYDPADQDELFLGWYATPEGNVTPKDLSAAYPYENETEVTINGNVVFSVYAPKGYWLNFEGNGKGAKYTPPQFIIKNSTDANGVTVEPEDPIRNGYTFDGWYTGAPAAEGEDPTGAPFDFGSSLEENTTLYAKWKIADSVSYSVIIWKQRATDDKNAEEAQKKYDVADVITLNGKPGESASNVVKQEGASVNTGRGNSVRNYKIDGEEKNYVGFHAGRYDTDVTIDPEGTTVLNVYYDRNLITISFDAGTYTTGYIFPQTHTRYIYDSSTKKYVNKVTYTGLYDSELSFDWPTQYWESSSGSGSASPMLWDDGTTVLTFYGAFKLSPKSKVSVNLTYNASGNTPIRFIRQKPDGNWPELTETDYVLIVYAGNGTFHIKDKYAGFTAYQYKKGDYSLNDAEWTPAKAEETSVDDYNALNIRFKRETFKIRYLDGTYFNGDGAIKEEATGVQLHESDPIYYQASIDEYNKEKYYNPGNKDEYVFAGWYADPTCTTEYKFETMPGNDIAVYAKWVQKQYRVFLHPNVPSDDASFSMGNQKTSFRADYNEKIANGYTIKAARDNYDLIGWYTDEACKNAFNFAAYRLNDTTVTTQYDTTPEDGIYNPTDETERDQYGNVESGQEGVNKDAQNNRIWILSKLELYAKWRSTLDGAKGIDIKYDAGEGTNPPKDDLQYLDNCEANAGAASTPNDETKQFQYWVVQKWGGTQYVDTEEKVYPGDVFTVLKANAKAVVTEWVNPNNDADFITVENPEPGTTAPDETHTKIKKATYTVFLRAEYGDKAAPTPTHITWYANNGTGDTISNTGLQINKAVDIVKPGNEITYNGYKFLGWARMKEVSDAQGKVTSIGGTAPKNLALDLSESDLFLKWDAENGVFLATATTGSGYEAGQEVKQIAADEKLDYHGMVAVWSAQYGVYHSSTGETVWYDMPTPPSTVDFTGLVAKDHLYGGYYKYVETSDPSQTHKGDAYTVSGKSVTPSKATVYYLKEVDKNYLKPNVYLVYNENHNGLIQDLYGFVNIDDVNDYTDCGVIVDGGDPRSVKNTLVSKSIVITKDGETKPYATLTPGNLFGQENAFFGYTSLKDKISGGATVQIKGYYVTKDNIKVTGYKDRMIKFAAEDPTYKAPVFTGWTTSPEGNTKCGLKSVTPTLEELTGSNSAGKLAARRTLTLTAPADQIEYRITKVYDTGSEEQTVQEGNHTGEISYTPKDGYLFVGWYKDQAFTEPADFSNVQSDMTVYARFVSKKNISLTMTRKSQKSGKTTFNTIAAVKDKAALGLEMVTVSTDTAKATLSTRTVKKSGSGKKVSYTTRYKGKISIKGLSEIDSFTVSVSWTTPDGTTVTGPVWTCTYNQGNVAIR